MCWQKIGSSGCWCILLEIHPLGPGKTIHPLEPVKLEVLRCQTVQDGVRKLAGRWVLLTIIYCRCLTLEKSLHCKSLMLDKLLTLQALGTGEATWNAGVYQASLPQFGSKILSSHSVSLAFSTEKASVPAEKGNIF